MDYDVDYDEYLRCFVLHWAGEAICLKARSVKEAFEEAKIIVDDWYE